MILTAALLIGASLLGDPSACGVPRQAQTTLDEAWRSEQKQRRELQAVLADPAAGRDAVKQALAGLEALKAWCESAEIRGLKTASGEPLLYFQRYDILVDLVGGYARLGDKQAVARLIKELGDALAAPDSYVKGDRTAMYSYYANVLVGNVHVQGLLPDDAIEATIARMRGLDPLRALRGLPFNAADTDKISATDRVAGLSLIWSEAKYNFANFDLVPSLDWDAAYRRYLPKVQAARDRYAYYNLLREFMGLLRDSHTDVGLPPSLRTSREAALPLSTALVEGKVVVSATPPATLGALGVRIGDVIRRIDGVDAVEYGRKAWAHRISASTPQDADVRVYSYMLLRGPLERKVRLDLEGPDGARTVTTSRGGSAATPPLSEFRLLPDGTAYFAFNSCESDAVSRDFVKQLPQIRKAGRLIIDCRMNGGGSSDVGYSILSHLIDEKVAASLEEIRVYRLWLRTSWSNAGAFERSTDSVAPAKDPFLGPVAVLIGPRTFSAAEDFLVAFKMAKRGVLVGMPSGGSTGQPISFKLPGGGSCRICAKRDRMADGLEFVGVGVQPDIRAQETIEAIRAGKDRALEEAVLAVRRGEAVNLARVLP